MSEAADLVRGARALVLDFDGTLVDSNPIKRRAFEACFAECPQRDEILAYCWGSHHAPRWEKFRHVYEQILRQPYTEARAASLHERFEAATTAQIIAAAEIPGATAFLRRVHGRYLVAVLSSTPDAVLREILAHRGWQDWFDVVQGAPVHKASWLTAFREQQGLDRPSLVFFGDTLEDAAAADEAGCAFIAVGEPDGPLGGRAVPNFMSMLRDDDR